jgi:opacity protein-like surface antigen
MLLYATGGIGFTSVEVNSNFLPTVAGGVTFPGTFVNDKQTFAGPTVGAGFEYAFWNNLSLGVEGRYTWYGSHTFNSGSVAAIALTPTTFAFTPVATAVNLNTWEVTARLNWKFDWWTAPAAVTSRY